MKINVSIFVADTGTELLKLKGWSVFLPGEDKIVVENRIHTVQIWNADSGEELRKLKEHTDWVESAAFSPDGKRIVTGSGDGTARIWDAESGSRLRVADSPSQSASRDKMLHKYSISL